MGFWSGMRGTSTSERITVKDTFWQIVLFVALQIILAFAALTLLAWWLHTLGNATGFLMLAIVAALLCDGADWRGYNAGLHVNSARWHKAPALWSLAVGAGAALIALAAFDVWPLDVYLVVDEWGWRLVEPWSGAAALDVRGWRWLFVPALLPTLPGPWQVLKWMGLLGSPAIFYALYTGWWASVMETTMPKLREMLFKAGAPESLARTPAPGLRPKSSRVKAEPEDEEGERSAMPLQPGIELPPGLMD